MIPIRNAECGLRNLSLKSVLNLEFGIYLVPPWRDWDLELGILRLTHYLEIH